MTPEPEEMATVAYERAARIADAWAVSTDRVVALAASLIARDIRNLNERVAVTPEQEIMRPIVRYAISMLFAAFCLAAVSILIVTTRLVFWPCP